MPIRIGANPIGWSNDDLQDIGGATPLETCLAEAREAGFVGMELGHKFPREPNALKTALDPFGRTAERKAERALIGEYENLVAEILAGLTASNHELAVRLASVPDEIKGYGHVKDAHLAKARRKQDELLRLWRNPEAARIAAE